MRTGRPIAKSAATDLDYLEVSEKSGLSRCWREAEALETGQRGERRRRGGQLVIDRDAGADRLEPVFLLLRLDFGLAVGAQHQDQVRPAAGPQRRAARRASVGRLCATSLADPGPRRNTDAREGGGQD